MPKPARFTALATVAALFLFPGLEAPAGEAGGTCEERPSPPEASPWDDICPAPAAGDENSAPAPPAPWRGASAMRAFKDPETGRLVYRPAGLAGLSMAERRMLSRSTEGLAPRTLPGGAVALDLQGRFMTLTVARRSVGGSITAQCMHASDREPSGHSLPRPAPSGSAAREARHE